MTTNCIRHCTTIELEGGDTEGTPEGGGRDGMVWGRIWWWSVREDLQVRKMGRRKL